MSLGVDYSFARPGGAAIRGAGFNFACRYFASSVAKRISAAEVADLFANGLGIPMVFEDYANPLQNHPGLSAYNAGVADAQLAVAQAGSVNFPTSLPIYFAVDFDVPDYAPQSSDARAKLGPFGDYFAGVNSVLGLSRSGGYGGYYLIKRLFDAGLISYGWQTLAWSGGQIDSRIHIYQNGKSALNGSCDVDESRQTNFGQWAANQGGNMPTPAQVVSAFHQYNVAGLDGGPEPTAGQVAYYAARDWGVLVTDLLNAVAAREKSETAAYDGQLQADQKQIADLKAQIAASGSDTTQLNALGALLKWFIARLGLK
jgi:hypothetical protein